MEKTRYIITLSAVLLLISCMSVMAAGVNQTPEIHGITTSTSIDVVGSASNSVSLAWTSGTGSVQPPLGGQDRVQTTSYTEDTMAVNGHTVYQKEFSVNTGNQLLDQSNVKSSRIITFEGINGGRMTSDESLLINTVGMPSSAAGNLLCPFGASSIDTIPAFCNIITAGSRIDATTLSVVTKASSRTVSASADIPESLSYSINVHGLSTANGVVPSEGSVEAYMRIHNQGGRGDSLIKSSDLQYEDTTRASGLISSFAKSMGYQGGVLLV